MNKELSDYISWYAGEYRNIPANKVISRTKDNFGSAIRRTEALALIREARHMPEPSEADIWKYTPTKYKKKRIEPKKMVVSKFRYHVKYRSERMGHNLNIEIDAGAVARTKSRSKELCLKQLELFLYSNFNYVVAEMVLGKIPSGRYKRGFFKEDYEGGFYEFKSVQKRLEDYYIRANNKIYKAIYEDRK